MTDKNKLPVFICEDFERSFIAYKIKGSIDRPMQVILKHWAKKDGQKVDKVIKSYYSVKEVVIKNGVVVFHLLKIEG